MSQLITKAMIPLRPISHHCTNSNTHNWAGVCVIPAYPPTAAEFQLNLDEVLGPIILANSGGWVRGQEWELDQ